MALTGNNLLKIGAAVLLASPSAFSQVLRKPAAREHVREVNGQGVKFTSKLATIVELNFTMGNGHQPGKKIITDGLTRIATAYGGLKVNKFASGSDGSQPNVVPAFTVADLMAGEVIVANNIGSFGHTALGTARRNAIQAAIEANGRGYLGFHGSGDDQTNGWTWFTGTLHPVSYKGHGNRSTAPVYKHLATARHVILDSILSTRVSSAIVPDELDGAGKEVLTPTPVATRRMLNEWYFFDRDISRDAAFKDKVTILLKYDPRGLAEPELGSLYKRKGGNLYTYLYQVGAGLTSYLPAGHANDELLDANTGFDGGTGDYDRYVAQTLFYLAGYDQTDCDASCNGLPLVDSRGMLTGRVPDGISGKASGRTVAMHPELVLDAARIAFTSTFDGPYEARVTDMRGRLLDRKRGAGETTYAFDEGALEPGVYFLSVKVGAHMRTRRYARFTGSRQPRALFPAHAVRDP
jgi:hypothetical protein